MMSNDKLNNISKDIDELLHESLQNAIHKETSKVRLQCIAKIACDHCPIDLAVAASCLPSTVRPLLYDNLPHLEAKCSFLMNTDKSTRIHVFRFLKDIEFKILLEKMTPDDAMQVMEDLSERRHKRMLTLLEEKKAKKIQELREHSPRSAGRLMTVEFFAFPKSTSISTAAGFIRDNPHIDFTKGIFVLNTSGELQGFVPARNMIVNSPERKLYEVMRPILHKVSADASREEVIELFERYKISFLPVVNQEGDIVGVITQEDVVEAMEDLADETMAKIGGTGENISLTDPLVTRFMARSPWLLVTLLAGMLNVAIMSSFESQEGKLLTFVLFFVPLITGMSGNIGIQCSTILVRSMAVSPSNSNKRSVYFKEILIGLFLGSSFGLFSGGILYVLGLLGLCFMGVSAVYVGVIVGIGLIGACFAGTFLGVFSPLFFQRIGVDPAIAAGPIVTAFNDFLSMTIYFLIAWGLGLLLF